MSEEPKEYQSEKGTESFPDDAAAEWYPFEPTSKNSDKPVDQSVNSDLPSKSEIRRMVTIHNDTEMMSETMCEMRDEIQALRGKNERLREVVSTTVAQWDEGGDIENCHIEALREALKEGQ